MILYISKGLFMVWFVWAVRSFVRLVRLVRGWFGLQPLRFDLTSVGRGV